MISLFNVAIVQISALDFLWFFLFLSLLLDMIVYLLLLVCQLPSTTISYWID